MRCAACGHDSPDRARTCASCDGALAARDDVSKVVGGEERRTVFLDLSDVGLSAELRTLDDVATAASHVYERFTPYADDGWEWTTDPSRREFTGWVAEEHDGRREITGVNLPVHRVARDRRAPESQQGYRVSEHRTRQRTEESWTAEPASKRWKRKERRG